MIEKIKQTPRPIIFGQIVFLLTIVIFILSIPDGNMFLSNYAVYGVLAGCVIGVLTSLVPSNKDWKFIVFDIVATALIFIAYVEVFSV